MLDIKKLRENTEEIIELLNRRGGDFTYLRDVVKWDEDRRALVGKVEEYKNYRNEKSKLIGELKREGKNADEILAEVDKYGDEIKELDTQLKEVDGKIYEALINTPNVPRETLNVGPDENYNKLLREVGERDKFITSNQNLTMKLQRIQYY